MGNMGIRQRSARDPTARTRRPAGTGRERRGTGSARRPSESCRPTAPNPERIAAVTSIQPQLWVDASGQAVDFYADAFGATVVHQVGEGDDIVAQLAVGDAAFWVSSAGPELG